MGPTQCNMTKIDVNDKMEITKLDKKRSKEFFGKEIIIIRPPIVIL